MDEISISLTAIEIENCSVLLSFVAFCWASLRFAEHYSVLLSIVAFCWALLRFAEQNCVLLSIFAFCWALQRFAEQNCVLLSIFTFCWALLRIFSMKMKMWWIHYSVADSIMIMYQNIEMILKSNHSSWGPKFDKSINHTRLADDFWSSSIFASCLLSDLQNARFALQSVTVLRCSKRQLALRRALRSIDFLARNFSQQSDAGLLPCNLFQFFPLAAQPIFDNRL